MAQNYNQKTFTYVKHHQEDHQQTRTEPLRRYQGHLKFFAKAKGFGFLTAIGQSWEIFLHENDIHRSQHTVTELIEAGDENLLIEYERLLYQG